MLRVTDDDVQLCFSDPKAFHASYKRIQLNRMLALWKEKECQGRIARTENVDKKLSSPHLSNLKLSDKLVKFVVKARIELTESNTVMHRYFPAEYTRACNRCGFHSDTLSHILNGCQESKNAIQSRHNRIMKIVASSVSDANPNSLVSMDSIVKPSMFFSQEPAFVNIQHSRPDICVIDHVSRKCMLAEVAIPYDIFINDSYQSKFFRYLPLCQRIGDLGYECKIIVLIIGSLGSVHNKFVNGLCMLGVPRTRAKAITRYCCISSITGSKIIWCQRCRAVLH